MKCTCPRWRSGDWRSGDSIGSFGRHGGERGGDCAMISSLTPTTQNAPRSTKVSLDRTSIAFEASFRSVAGRARRRSLSSGQRLSAFLRMRNGEVEMFIGDPSFATTPGCSHRPSQIAGLVAHPAGTSIEANPSELSTSSTHHWVGIPMPAIPQVCRVEISTPTSIC